MQGCGAPEVMYFLKCIFLKCLYPKCIFAKCTRLACLLSFASLFIFWSVSNVFNPSELVNPFFNVYNLNKFNFNCLFWMFVYLLLVFPLETLISVNSHSKGEAQQKEDFVWQQRFFNLDQISLSCPSMNSSKIESWW